MAASNSSGSWDIPNAGGPGSSNGNHGFLLVITIAILAFLSGIFIAVAVITGLSGRGKHDPVKETSAQVESQTETQAAAQAEKQAETSTAMQSGSQTETSAAMQSGSQTEAAAAMQSETQASTHAENQTETQAAAYTERQTEKETELQPDIPTAIQTGTEIEDNNSYSSANEILTNETYRGQLSANRDHEEDWFVFTIPENGAVTIRFNTPMQADNDFYWNLVLNTASNPTASSHYDQLWYATLKGYDADYSSVPLGLPAGTYYLKIYSSSSWSSDTYELEIQYEVSDVWEMESNNTFKSATDIGLNTVYNGVLQDNRDYEEDWFVFTLPKTGVITLHFDVPMQDDNDFYWNLILTTAANPTAGSRDDQVWYATLKGFETGFASVPLSLPAGTYYLRIYSSSSWSSDPYALELQYDTPGNWEVENNDSFKDANPIELNTVYNGVLQNNRDYEEDWYVFTLSEPSSVTVRFEAPMQDGSDFYWRISLRPGNNPTTESTSEQLWSQGIRGYETSASSGELQLDAGTYYLKVTSAYGWSTDIYSLSVSR